MPVFAFQSGVIGNHPLRFSRHISWNFRQHKIFSSIILCFGGSRMANHLGNTGTDHHRFRKKVQPRRLWKPNPKNINITNVSSSSTWTGTMSCGRCASHCAKDITCTHLFGTPRKQGPCPKKMAAQRGNRASNYNVMWWAVSLWGSSRHLSSLHTAPGFCPAASRSFSSYTRWLFCRGNGPPQETTLCCEQGNTERPGRFWRCTKNVEQMPIALSLLGLHSQCGPGDKNRKS